MNSKPSKLPATSASIFTTQSAESLTQRPPMSGLDEGQSSVNSGSSMEYLFRVKPQSINLMTLPRYVPPDWQAPIR